MSGETTKLAALFLDSVEPGWFERINIEILRIQSPCNCIMGQLYGSWNSLRSTVLTNMSSALFFATLIGDTNQWKHEILARRKKVPLTAYGDDVQCPSATPVEALIGA